MKKIIALSLFLCVILSSCSFNKSVNNDTGSNNIQERQATDVVGSEDEDVPEFTNLSDPELCSYLEKNIYTDVITTLDSADYLVEDVKATYVSKEYLDELAYNSKSNIYFGYNLEDVEKEFGNEKYIFTCDES